MRHATDHSATVPQGQSAKLMPAAGEAHKPVLTRFGDAVDVRNRGTLRMSRFAGSQTQAADAPAIVRLWMGDQCRELSAHQARAIAAQLLEAATLAEQQNNH